VAPAGAATKSRGTLTASERSIADVNVGDVTLNDATTTSAKIAKVQNPYKKQAVVIPALHNSEVTSDITVILHAATSVTASSVSPSTLSVY
jgi:hypothetical protein